MKRRTLVKQLGTASLATTTLVGSAAAERPLGHVDREIDVSDLEGRVPLVDVLEEEELGDLADDVDPESAALTIDSDVGVLNVGEDCCDIFPTCCFGCPSDCSDCSH